MNNFMYRRAFCIHAVHKFVCIDNIFLCLGCSYSGFEGTRIDEGVSSTFIPWILYGGAVAAEAEAHASSSTAPVVSRISFVRGSREGVSRSQDSRV